MKTLLIAVVLTLVLVEASLAEVDCGLQSPRCEAQGYSGPLNDKNYRLYKQNIYQVCQYNNHNIYNNREENKGRIDQNGNYYNGRGEYEGRMDSSGNY